jgi:hypothetical protein
MQPYQTRYIENMREIVRLRDLSAGFDGDFDAWYGQRREASNRIDALFRENTDLLDASLFPVLDDLHNATPETIAELVAFGDQLMDWHTNLDCGVYNLIHDALLSLYRVRRDRNGVIRELYKLGMGLYYQRRTAQGLARSRLTQLYFENEMIFTEAGSYLKFFDSIEDEETKGYIIRALANIALCTIGTKKRIAASGKVLRICRDDYYRNLAPGLPWDVFEKRTNMQMSSNRNILSRGDLNADELAEVLGACQIVFEPENATDTPNVRWLWPYYEMEYNCGFVDLATTLQRMEHLIDMAPYDRYDTSGLYSNIQLPLYYAHLMRETPSMQTKDECNQFLLRAYRKMMKTLLTFPLDHLDDSFDYALNLVSAEYYEIPGAESYKDVMLALMRRYDPILTIRALRTGEIAMLLAGALLRGDAAFFDDIPFLKDVTSPARKKALVLDYARECGLLCNIGLLKMNMERLMRSRKLFESEQRLYELHTVAGRDDLKEHASTERFADVAHGHHSWYNGAGGYPDDYVRTDSPYRQMTDVIAVAVALVDASPAGPDAAIERVLRGERTRFSPLVTSWLHDLSVRTSLQKILSSTDESYYRVLFDRIRSDKRRHEID